MLKDEDEHEHKFIIVNKEKVPGSIFRRGQFRIVMICQKCGESKVVVDIW